nr:hypothetical protein [Tanacetum cinerariifolium]
MMYSQFLLNHPLPNPTRNTKQRNSKTQAPKVPSPSPSPKHVLPLPSNDLLLGGKDSMKLKELMDLCTHLSNKVLELESKDADDEELADVEEVLEVVKAAKLMREVVTTTGATTTAEVTKVRVPKRRRDVVIQDPMETTSTIVVHLEVQSK